ncbi:hypothetical protein ACWDWU_41770, partial [Streptomyces sp. NPDC003442]
AFRTILDPIGIGFGQFTVVVGPAAPGSRFVHRAPPRAGDPAATAHDEDPTATTLINSKRVRLTASCVSHAADPFTASGRRDGRPLRTSED